LVEVRDGRVLKTQAPWHVLRHKILENFLKIAGEHPSQQKKKAA
jgi:hypothetical protein